MVDTTGLRNLETRNVDGTGNNAANSQYGSANTNFIRLGDAQYADGVGTPEDRENPRQISNTVLDQAAPVPNSFAASDLFTFFGQFIDHDIDLTPEGTSEKIVIGVPDNDPVFDPDGELEIDRSKVATGTGENGIPRQHVNAITSFADASNVYGSSATVTSLLRADNGASAYLLTGDDGYTPTLGQLREAYPGLDASNPGLIVGPQTNEAFVGGDVRINENIALTSMHTVWIKEHNHQVDRLRDEHLDWSENELFEAAKIIVEAEYQNVVFKEYLPLLVGAENIPAYGGYDASIDPSIAHEFATAAYRLGHSQLGSLLHRIDEKGEDSGDGAANLFELFFQPGELAEDGGLDSLVRGLSAHKGQEVDANIVDDVRNLLFGPGDAGRDLAVLNILRGRDHGIPTLNNMRADLGLDVYSDFSQITSDPTLAAQLAQSYISIDNVDLWVGGLAENKVSGSQLGSTFQAIVLDQFLRLRDGDRFYFEERLKDFPELLAEIKETSFSEIIVRNTGIDYLQDDVFIAHNRIGGTWDGDYLEGTNEHDLILGFEGHDNLVGRRGDDDLYGGDGNDYLRGQAGNDLLNGEAGDDVLVGGAGNDELLGGDGNDWLSGGRGDDLIQGGADHDVLKGDAGNDMLYGESNGTKGGTAEGGNDALEGGRGDDIAVGDAAILADDAQGGDDYVAGGRGDDTLYGDAIEMTGSARGGDDNVQGGAGDDTLYGDAATMAAGTQGGDDYLVGGRGNDTLIGGSGNDFMEGGRGNDVFVFGPGSGEDIVWDFRQVTGNDDTLDVSGYGFTALTDFTISDIFGDAVIELSAQDNITLVGVDASSLTAEDFLLA